MALTDADNPQSADWWLLKLGKDLRARRPQLDLWWKYYTGEHPLPEGPKRQTLAYRDFLKKTRTNFMKVVVNSSVHRLQAIGIADEKGNPDQDANRWWQLNKLDARQKQLYRAVLSQSVAYTMVGPHPSDPKRPLITIEHPREVIVETDPATGERLAALKAWWDPIQRIGRANVLLPDRIVKYQTDRRGPGPLPWGKTTWTHVGDVPHTMKAVPVVPFRCRPELDEDPLPEFGAVIEIQDRINFGILNRMSSERMQAFRQRFVTGHKFKTTIDPMTGIEVVENPFVADPGSLWSSSGENVRFGEFAQADVTGYLKSNQADIMALLVVSETPSYVYAGDLVNVATDTITALDVNHVAKIFEHQGDFGEGIEETMSLAARQAEVEKDYTAAEVRWRDPRQINPAVAADAAVKKKTIGYPLAVLAEDLGESPQRIQRILSEAAADALLAAQLAPPPVPAAAPAPGVQPPGEE